MANVKPQAGEKSVMNINSDHIKGVSLNFLYTTLEGEQNVASKITIFSFTIFTSLRKDAFCPLFFLRIKENDRVL